MRVIVADLEAEDKSTAGVKTLVGANSQLEIEQIIGILEIGFASWW